MEALHDLKAAIDGYNDATAKNIDALKKRIDEVELASQRPRFAPANDNFAAANDNASPEEAKAFDGYLRKGAVAPELKTMYVGSDPDGGYAVVSPLAQTISKRIFEVSPIRQVARIVTITSDAYEELASTDEAEAQWVSEQQARPETTTPQLKKLRIAAEEMYAMPKATDHSRRRVV